MAHSVICPYCDTIPEASETEAEPERTVSTASRETYIREYCKCAIQAVFSSMCRSEHYRLRHRRTKSLTKRTDQQEEAIRSMCKVLFRVHQMDSSEEATTLKTASDENSGDHIATEHDLEERTEEKDINLPACEPSPQATATAPVEAEQVSSAVEIWTVKKEERCRAERDARIVAKASLSARADAQNALYSMSDPWGLMTWTPSSDLSYC